MARPLRGGGREGQAIKEKKTFFSPVDNNRHFTHISKKTNMALLVQKLGREKQLLNPFSGILRPGH